MIRAISIATLSIDGTECSQSSRVRGQVQAPDRRKKPLQTPPKPSTIAIEQLCPVAHDICTKMPRDTGLEIAPQNLPSNLKSTSKSLEFEFTVSALSQTGRATQSRHPLGRTCASDSRDEIPRKPSRERAVQHHWSAACVCERIVNL